MWGLASKGTGRQLTGAEPSVTAVLVREPISSHDSRRMWPMQSSNSFCLEKKWNQGSLWQKKTCFNWILSNYILTAFHMSSTVFGLVTSPENTRVSKMSCKNKCCCMLDNKYSKHILTWIKQASFNRVLTPAAWQMEDGTARGDSVWLPAGHGHYPVQSPGQCTGQCQTSADYQECLH